MLNKIKTKVVSFILWILYGKDWLHIQLLNDNYKRYKRLNGQYIVQDSDGMKAFKPWNSTKWYDWDLGFEYNEESCKLKSIKNKHKQINFPTLF